MKLVRAWQKNKEGSAQVMLARLVTALPRLMCMSVCASAPVLACVVVCVCPSVCGQIHFGIARLTSAITFSPSLVPAVASHGAKAATSPEVASHGAQAAASQAKATHANSKTETRSQPATKGIDGETKVFVQNQGHSKSPKAFRSFHGGFPAGEPTCFGSGAFFAGFEGVERTTKCEERQVQKGFP